jgi:hypothetical protein
MSNDSSNYEEVVQKLEQMRDEIQLKIHLAAADVRDEWTEVEKKFQHVRGRAGRVAEAAEDAAEGVGDALELAAKEVREGFEKIKNLL